jgi:hypothetical protein
VESLVGGSQVLELLFQCMLVGDSAFLRGFAFVSTISVCVCVCVCVCVWLMLWHFPACSSASPVMTRAQDPSSDVRQSSFALLGDLCRSCFVHVAPHIRECLALVHARPSVCVCVCVCGWVGGWVGGCGCAWVWMPEDYLCLKHAVFMFCMKSLLISVRRAIPDTARAELESR